MTTDKKEDKDIKNQEENFCYLCNKEISIGRVYCIKCQGEIDDALCNYDHWPFNR